MKWYQYLEDAKQIPELYNSISEIARCEKKRIEDYSISFFVETAKNLLTMNLSLEQIAQATSLPLEKIQELASEVTK